MKKGYQSFKELKVWQEARTLAVRIYKITSSGALSRDFGFRDQIRRAAISIPSNIAEGYERGTDKEFIRYIMIAKGSIAELRTQLEIAKEIDYLDSQIYDELENLCNKIGAMLTKLIRARSANNV